MSAKTDRQEELKTITKNALEELKKSISEGKSDELIKYLEGMAKFPKYSFRNLMLILRQRPTAGRVMGYRAWAKMGRQVKKGERALRIWAPMTIKDKTQDSEDNELIFRPVCVFDESQTEGEALPELSGATGDVGENLEKLKEFTKHEGIELDYEEGMAPDGYSTGGKVVLKSGLSEPEEFHVLAHELAHEFIHHKKTRKGLTKTQVETEAEAAAFVVSKYIGLDIGTCSSDYIQIYKGDEKTLLESLSIVQKTAERIIKGLEVKET